jgi:hypothetical protein
VPAVLLRFWPKKGKYRKWTAAAHRLRLCRHRRQASLLSTLMMNHPCSRRYHQYFWLCRRPCHRRLYRRVGRHHCQWPLLAYVHLRLQPSRPPKPLLRPPPAILSLWYGVPVERKI